jgi:hypothetical protein
VDEEVSGGEPPVTDEPRDPDWDDVPDEIAAWNGRRVLVLTEEGVERLPLIVLPGAWGAARRLLEADD